MMILKILSLHFMFLLSKICLLPNPVNLVNPVKNSPIS
jgi:hypothetical protein